MRLACGMNKFRERVTGLRETTQIVDSYSKYVIANNSAGDVVCMFTPRQPPVSLVVWSRV